MFQWKMVYNSDPSKQAIQIHFSHKHDNENYPSLVFNDTKVQLTVTLKHLELILDSKLEHIDNKINKCNKIIGIIKRLFFNPVKKKPSNNTQILCQA